MASMPSALASTIQDAHINKEPDLLRDIAPATAADEREVVSLTPSSKKQEFSDRADRDDDIEDIPYSVLRPAPRPRQLPPLPDLRFEQSYLHSLAGADTWWKVALITTRDQVLMPLTQGIAYNLFLCGWQHWNRNARIHGDSYGARLRRWWYELNNWRIPEPTKSQR